MPANRVDPYGIVKVVYFSEMPKTAGPTSGLAAWVMTRLGVPGWGQVLLVVLVAAFGTGIGLFWNGYSKLNKIESAVRVLASKIPDVKDLVKELLSQAQNDVKTGELAKAQKAIQLVDPLLSSAARNKIPAEPAYFRSSVADFDKLQSSTKSDEIVERIRAARVTLAEYRSALNREIPSPGARVYRVSNVIDDNTFQVNVGEEGLVIDLSDVPNLSLFAPQAPYRSGLQVENPKKPAFIMNGTQQLDGLHWLNVVFVKMRIKYAGGSVELQNVKFVDCLFDFESGTNSDQLANDIALGVPRLSLKG
jgi:hypothetical protein